MSLRVLICQAEVMEGTWRDSSGRAGLVEGTQPISAACACCPGEAAPPLQPRFCCPAAAELPTVTLGNCHPVVVGPLMPGKRLEEILGLQERPEGIHGPFKASEQVFIPGFPGASKCHQVFKKAFPQLQNG